jgi:nitrate/nitrite transporter NarK
LINSIKVLGQWFPPHQLGLANGVQSMSMALGFMIGSLFSATVFSPLLGGWSNVLIVYGLIGAAFSIPWIFTRTSVTQPSAGESPSVRKALSHVVGLKNIWLLALGLLGVGGAIQGMLGYLPLYLRGEGWPPIQADGALFAFHTASMILVLPVSLWSDRLKFRKPLLLITNLLIISGLALLSVVSGGMVWVAVLLSGSMRDAFMAIFTTMTIETEHVGPLYAGTAVGFAFALGSIGNLIAPPVGNSLASLWPGAPFAFWSLLAVFGFVCLFFVKEKGRDTNRALVPSTSIPLRSDI